jgi:hypothetical protein
MTTYQEMPPADEYFCMLKSDSDILVLTYGLPYSSARTKPCIITTSTRLLPTISTIEPHLTLAADLTQSISSPETHSVFLGKPRSYDRLAMTFRPFEMKPRNADLHVEHNFEILGFLESWQWKYGSWFLRTPLRGPTRVSCRPELRVHLLR